jgi:hypothetical protein
MTEKQLQDRLGILEARIKRSLEQVEAWREEQKELTSRLDAVKQTTRTRPK